MAEPKTGDWPNQTEIVDGVIPAEKVTQDPFAFVDTDDDLNREMDI